MLHTDVISFSFFIALDDVHFRGESNYVGLVGGKKVGFDQSSCRNSCSQSATLTLCLRKWGYHACFIDIHVENP